MKYCTKCGQINNDDAKFCYNCGKQFSENLINNDPNPENIVIPGSPYYKVVDGNTKKEESNESTLNTVSMILGIMSLGFYVITLVPFSFISSIIAIITGIVALVRNPSQIKTKALLGIIFGVVAFLIAIIIFIFYPYIAKL